MKLSTCKKALKFVIKTVMSNDLKNIPRPVLVGDSGVGKTATVRQVYDELIKEGMFNKDKAVFIERHLGQVELGDLIGLPDLDKENNKTVWREPCWWPAQDAEGILFFDEFGDTKNDIQRAVQQLLMEGSIYEHYLPKKMYIVLAMNPVGNDFGSYEFSRQLRNRLMFWDIRPNMEEWLEHLYEQDVLCGIDKIVTSQSSGILDAVDYTVDLGYKNPRSIMAAAALAKYFPKEDVSDYAFSLFSSICGSYVAGGIVNILADGASVKYPLSASEILNDTCSAFKAKLIQYDNVADRDCLHETGTIIKALSAKEASKTAMENIRAFLEYVPDDLAVDCIKGIGSKNKMLALRIVKEAGALKDRMTAFFNGGIK